MEQGQLTELVLSGLIIFAKNGKMDSVRAPEFGEVVIKYKDGTPYAVAITENKKI